MKTNISKFILGTCFASALSLTGCIDEVIPNQTATEEQYAICVTPGNTELLNAINEVLEEMIANGEIDALVSKHLGLE